MALLSLFFDVTSCKLVRGLHDASVFSLPEFHQEDTLTIEVTPVKRVGWIFPPFFGYVGIGGYSLYAAIGSAGTVLASQDEGGFTKDVAYHTFTGSINLNTAGINALADGTEKTFELRLFDGTNYYRCQSLCRIRKSVALAAALATTPSDVALGAKTADALYMRKKGKPGEGVELTSEDGTKSALIWLDNDGTIRIPGFNA